MSLNQLENQNPHVYSKTDERTATLEEEDDSVVDPFDRREIFGKLDTLRCWHFYNTIISDLIREINDPEHPLTLEELHVVQEDLVEINNEQNTVDINFTPTIPHCSMATLIGLSIRVKLLRCLPARFKVSNVFCCHNLFLSHLTNYLEFNNV